jgi:DNA-binding CsgD family transcriptional regulator
LSETHRLRIALKLDGKLRQQLAAALSGHVEIVGEDEAHDAVLVAAEGKSEIEQVFSAREAEVLELMAEGASNSEIARRLGISFHTAKFHVRTVTDKLDATGRTDAVISAVRKGLLQL